MKAKKSTSSSAKDASTNEIITIPVVVPGSVSLPKFQSTAADLPLVPIPKHKQDMPPLKSAYGIWEPNHDQKYNIKTDVLGYINPKTPGWKIQPPIPNYHLVYRTFWMRLNMQRVPGPQSFEYSVSTTEGISETTSLELSAQLGVQTPYLSASLGITFKREINVSKEKSETRTYTINVPEGKIGIWVLWQLIQEFIAIDNSGKQILWSGKVSNGFLGFNAKLPVTLVTEGGPIYTPQLTLFDI